MRHHDRRELGVWDVLRRVAAAARFCPLAWPFSILGMPPSWLEKPYSEYDMFWEPRGLRPERYLLDVLIPSFPRRAPSWLPRPFSTVFFHQSGVLKPVGTDPDGTFRSERWLFINGILTNQDLARENAAYLFALFRRPITPVWDCTDGIGVDLVECASEELGTIDSGVENALGPLLQALADPASSRVVLIAHSRGTLITSVLLRILANVYAQTAAGVPGELNSDDREAVRSHARRTEGINVDSVHLEPITPEQLAKLEVYCFANCAGEMTYIDEASQRPWIESFGNQHDLVARLGMLCPLQSTVTIAGPRFRHDGAWGHLLNAHYLRAIDHAHKEPSPPINAAPYVVMEGTAAPDAVPRLFRYLRGGAPVTASD